MKNYNAKEVVLSNLLKGVLATENPYEGFRGERWNVSDWEKQVCAKCHTHASQYAGHFFDGKWWCGKCYTENNK